LGGDGVYRPDGKAMAMANDQNYGAVQPANDGGRIWHWLRVVGVVIGVVLVVVVAFALTMTVLQGGHHPSQPGVSATLCRPW